MPYPTPHNSQVELLTGIPLDNSYRNSIWFANAGAQATYFLNHRKTALEHFDCMYHRESDELRVNAPIQDCLDVNYVMWQNHAYSPKWFYAFVTECRYINANCTGLKIELDVLQTWYFDYELKPCFIERCHTPTDNIGEYILPEPVETGEFDIVDITSTRDTLFKTWDIIVYTTFQWGTWAQPTSVGDITDGNVFSGLRRTNIGRIELYDDGAGNVVSRYVIDPTGQLADLINNHANLVDGVVAIMMAPHVFEVNKSAEVVISKPSASTPIHGYTPKCNKLYTKQFYHLMVTDGMGDGKYYHFEDFDTNFGRFTITSDRAPTQTIICTPESYKGSRNIGFSDNCFIESITMTGFAQCAWVSDAFKTYLAQNQASLGLTIATAAAQTVAGAGMIIGSGGIGAVAGGGMAVSGLNTLVSTLATLRDREQQPPKMHGNVTNTALMAVGEKCFSFITLAAKAQYLKIADDFMNMYGYTYERVGVPDIHARPAWTYNKTNGALAVPAAGSGCTATALRRIQSIFDAGITFWADGYEVGDYSLDNRV